MVVILRSRVHGAICRSRRKACVDVQNASHGNSKHTEELHQGLAAQELHEPQSHNLTETNVVVHAVSDGRYTIMLTNFATI